MLSRVLRQVSQKRQRRQSARRLHSYFKSGQIPWTEGYHEYKWQCIESSLADPELLERFRSGSPLPSGYGTRLDERIVEYPWVFSQMNSGAGIVLDAGSTLNYPSLLIKPVLREQPVIIYDLSPDGCFKQANVSYIYGDLREMILKDAVVDCIVCVSTLEHIGMDNTLLYTTDERYFESAPDTYRLALQEFNRVLTPEGRLLLTVPFGRYEHHGWLQQFNLGMLEDVVESFGGELIQQVIYQYTVDGWQLSEAELCAESRYFDIQAKADRGLPELDYAAAARAVACLELAKVV